MRIISDTIVLLAHEQQLLMYTIVRLIVVVTQLIVIVVVVMAMLIAYVKWRHQKRKNCYGSVNERQNNQRKRTRWLDRLERDR